MSEGDRGSSREVQNGRVRVRRTAEEIVRDTDRIGADIRRIAQGRPPVFIAILKGSFVFLADLIRAFREPHEIDFLSVTRYDPSQKDQHSVRILHDLATSIDGRLVVVVEGIRTRGSKVEYVDRFLKLHGAGEIRYCAMVRQKGSVGGAVPLDSWGFEADDEEYVIGYGLDLDERYRNLPFIGVLEDRAETGKSG